MPNTPNIVLINADDLGWGDLGCYGHSVHKTPVLDQMASEGMRFTSFYQASPVCSPSRGAMLTGCHPRRIGFDSFEGQSVLFPGQGVGLSPNEETFADVVKKKGYATAMIGKWHCGDQKEFLPTEHGFDLYYGLPYSNDMGRCAGRSEAPPLPLLHNTGVIEQQPDQASLTSRYVEESIRFMRENSDRPFLLYFAHMHVHLPHYVPERFARENPNPYAAAVQNIDWAMGRILSEIQDLGLDENTLVLFTSDNGSRCDFGPSNGPFQGIKGTTWEGGMRLPLIARMPGTVPADAVNDDIITGMDIMPTIAAMSNSARSNDRFIDGMDFSPLLKGSSDSTGPREVFFYYAEGNLDAVRYRNWKLCVGRHGWAKQQENGPIKGISELYDLSIDPGENNDVSAENPEMISKLKMLLEECRSDLGDETTGIEGSGRRPIGRVDNPVPLTSFDPNYPYFAAMYDLEDMG